MHRLALTSLCLAAACLFPRVASATKSSELYTSAPYPYGRFESRVRFTAGDGVVSAFFLWKEGSEVSGTFWNELDYEKIDADCKLQTNALYGNPAANHNKGATVNVDLCSGFHVYAYEWTADYIAWFFDGTEVRRETGETASAFAQNATAGMQVHFNIWPGDSTFGGTLNPSILPVHQLVDWVQFSSYADGMFTLAWREDFDAATLPTGWLTGDWDSPKALSTHLPANVNFLSSCAVLSLTSDDAPGSTGADTTGCTPGMGSGGAAGASSQGGMAGAGAGASTGGAGASAGGAPNGGAPEPGGSGGTNASGAPNGVSGMTGTGGAGAGSSTGGSGAVATGAAAGASSAGTPSATGGSGGATAAAGGTASSVGGSAGGTAAAGGTESSAGHGTKDGDASGCGCRVPGSTDSSQSERVAGAALVLALAGAFRRRRASRSPRVR